MNPSIVKNPKSSVVRPTEYLNIDPAQMRGPAPAILPEKETPAGQTASSTARNVLEDRYFPIGSGACVAYLPKGWMSGFDKETNESFPRRGE